MMKSTPSTSVRQVGSGVYRVSGKSARSVMTGRFVTKSSASSRPSSKTSSKQVKSGNSTTK